MITGKCDFKLLVWKKLQDMPDIKGDDLVYKKFKTYAEVATDFVAKEVKTVFTRDRAADMFKDIARDDFDKLNK